MNPAPPVTRTRILCFLRFSTRSRASAVPGFLLRSPVRTSVNGDRRGYGRPMELSTATLVPRAPRSPGEPAQAWDPGMVIGGSSEIHHNPFSLSHETRPESRLKL